jgi:SAM-dependent methyltransferase
MNRATRARALPQLGLSGTLQQQQQELEEIQEQLRRIRNAEAPLLRQPFRLDSTRACFSTYRQALQLVQQRFWTTTFLHSQFWTQQSPDLLQANADMSQRLAAQGGEVRRLFLLDQRPQQVLRSQREQRILLERLGHTGELQRLDQEFLQLRRNVADLEALGCEVRAVFDTQPDRNPLPEELGWDSSDCELAIYDDFRVDVFAGARHASIREVSLFTPVMEEFDALRDATARFFQQLWEQSCPMADFLQQLQETLASNKSRIHYRANWLARYEFALDPQDQALKTVEGHQVVHELRQRQRWGRLASLLDIGTCTGRYPLLLRAALHPRGQIVALDDDPDCVQFSRTNIERTVAVETEGAKIEVLSADFGNPSTHIPGAPFDLITCMMSTLSHFGQERRVDQQDLLQSVLVHIGELLAEDGVFLFSSWTESACQARDFLSIYEQEDRRRLADWTPAAAELQQRLEAAGWLEVRRIAMDPRLDLWICAKRQGAPR